MGCQRETNGAGATTDIQHGIIRCAPHPADKVGAVRAVQHAGAHGRGLAVPVIWRLEQTATARQMLAIQLRKINRLNHFSSPVGEGGAGLGEPSYQSDWRPMAPDAPLPLTLPEQCRTVSISITDYWSILWQPVQTPCMILSKRPAISWFSPVRASPRKAELPPFATP